MYYVLQAIDDVYAQCTGFQEVRDYFAILGFKPLRSDSYRNLRLASEFFLLKIYNPANVSKPLSRSSSKPNLYPLNNSTEYLLRKKQTTGEKIAMAGVILSFTSLLVNNPKEYNPGNGP
jgi:hypothetical protein